MKKNMMQILTIILYLIAGALCGLSSVVLPINKYDSFLPFLLILLFNFYFAMILQIIIHEGGHLLFGLLTGYRFQSFRIFQFMWIKKKDGIHLKRYSLAGTAGQCLMSPLDYKEPYPFQLYHYGGVLMNLISSVIFLILFLLLNNPYLRYFFLCMMIIGILFAITNGIPIQSTVDNDGMNVKNMKKSQEARYACYQQLKINEYLSLDVRLKDVDSSLFTLYNGEALQNNLCVTVNIETCLYFFDNQDYLKAKDIAKAILQDASQLMPIHRYILKSIIIFYDLLEDINNPEIIQLRDQEYNKYAKVLAKDLSTIRSEYAYALLFESNEKKAEQLLKQFEKISYHYPYLGEIESEKEHIENIKKHRVS